MIKVKLVVIFLCFNNIISSSNRYCKICQNHVLCKYRRSGPSTSCKGYDKSSLLTNEDVNNIVIKMNERRNFIASGLSRFLPQAANMNKVFWSDELAVFAQKWVDQCDPETRPDKEDECRDLDDTKVAQNIVSVSGPTTGMIVHSLIDVWFTKGLNYRGSVSYYNYSRDWRTNYFTQLIWAETDKVGCGKAKFYAESKNSMIERLVCNFAPGGNIHGKPVYAVGYPATQCQKNKVPDKIFTGLCTYMFENNVRNFTTRTRPVSSLLRILNLSNNSAKQDIDPVRNDLKQVKFDHNGTNEQRNQKIRHVFLNNSHAFLKNVPETYGINNMRNHPYQTNLSRNERPYKHQERGHSRVYHGHDSHEDNLKAESRHTINFDLRKYDHTTEPLKSASNDDIHKKYVNNHGCTRKNIPPNPINDDCETTCQFMTSHCTRGYVTENCIHTTKICQDNLATPNFQHEYPREQCPCDNPTTCRPTPTKCQCNVNCPCLKPNCSSTLLALGLRRQNDPKYTTKKSAEFHYYDLFPNLEIRSGDTSKEIVQSFSGAPWLQQESKIGNSFKLFTHSNKKYDPGDKRDTVLNKNYSKQESDYLYDSTDSRERKRRNPEDDITFKPFWQMDEFNNERVGQLKSLIYTTLQNKKTKRTTSNVRSQKTTETITVKLKKIPNSIHPLKNAITEKYLSFDELMHLRRFGATGTNILVDARRNEANMTKTTIDYTTNTPFERKKHCTRKLTCTWTAASMTDSNGSIIGHGIDGDRGSRTPPGYVEGCTRTSTCTRDYMDRNKFSTLQEDSSTESAATQIEDEDYCEKRALNVQKRESYLEDQTIKQHTVFNLENKNSANENREVTDSPYDLPSSSISMVNCECNKEYSRMKRNKNFDLTLREVDKNGKTSYEYLSYGDLYYLVLQKIIQNWKIKQNLHDMNTCLCNNNYSVLLKSSIFLVLFTFLYNLLLNIFMGK